MDWYDCYALSASRVFALIMNIMTTSSIVTRISINVAYHALSSCQYIYILIIYIYILY